MILVGNQRGGGKDLAAHLMKSENENVEVYDIRGFVGNTLRAAFQESYAMSKGTQRCKQHLFSLSLSPPIDAEVSVNHFLSAIERAEKRLGLSGQPRAIVFHEKFGEDGRLRRHAHSVWCRINTDEMKSVHLPFTKRILMDLTRELFIEHGWKMPRGLLNKQDRSPLNFTLAEWQQAKRAGKKPREVKRIFQDAWALSDSKTSFAAALKEQGYILAQGDRRGFVAVDYQGEKFAVARAVGIKTKQVRARLGEPEDLPSIEKAQTEAAEMMAERIKALQSDQASTYVEEHERLKAGLEKLRNRHASQRRRLADRQAAHRVLERATNTSRLRTGLLGLWDRLTGRRRKILQQIYDAEADAHRRDKRERDAMLRQQAELLDLAQRQQEAAQGRNAQIQTELSADIASMFENAASREDKKPKRRRRQQRRREQRRDPNR